MNPLPSGHPLMGYIEHRLHLAGRCSERSGQKKQSHSGGVKRPFAECQEDPPPWRNAGFFLVDEKNSSEYLLVIPQTLLKMVCDAARFHRAVKVGGYSILELEASSRHGITTNPAAFNLLEVHHDGISFLSDTKDPPRSNFTPLTLSQLEKLERANDEKTKQNQCKEQGRKEFHSVTAKVDAISPIIAAVPSDPFALIELYDDSTACNAPSSAVAVLKGSNALACHTGIQPGDTISLHNVRKQKWHVPSSFAKKELQRLKNRSPLYVLVVDKAEAILWNTTSLQRDSSVTNVDLIPFDSPPLPSTPVPLVSIQGRVISCHFARTGSEGRMALQSVEFLSAIGDTPMTLYLNYFPMSPTLQIGLRSGALFRAVNVHALPRPGQAADTMYAFGACLRSTVTIRQCSNENHASVQRSNNMIHNPYNGRSSTVHRKKAKVTSSQVPLGNNALLTQAEGIGCSSQCAFRAQTSACHRFVDDLAPFAFVRIRISLMEVAYQEDLLRSWFEKSLFSDFSVPDISLPNFDEIIKTLIGVEKNGTTKSKRKRKVRDPYAEFLDHGCTESMFLEDDTSASCLGGCDVSWFDSRRSEDSWPAVIGLHDIRVAATQVLRSRIASMSSASSSTDNSSTLTFSDMVQGGWTASIHLTNSMLLQEIERIESDHETDQKSISRCTVGRLCTAGVVLSTGKGSLSIADGRCQLPASEICTVGENSSVCGNKTKRGDFVVANVETCIVSCLCLGAMPVVRHSTTQQTHGIRNEQSKEDNRKSKNGNKPIITPRLSEVSLPPYPPLAIGNNTLTIDKRQPSDGFNRKSGSCSLFKVEGMLFVASVQIRCSSFARVGEAVNLQGINDDSQSTCVSVRDCLSSSQLPREDSCDTGTEDGLKLPAHGVVRGLLTRQRFKFAKVRNGTYNGCVLTVSHSPFRAKASVGEDKKDTSRCTPLISTVQSIELKVSMDAPRRRKMQMQKYIKQIIGSEHGLDNLCTMAVAWWGFADSPQSCAVVSGGWDEFNHPPTQSRFTRTQQTSCVHVEFPLSAVSSSEHGYVRFKCHLNDIRAYCVVATSVSCPHEEVASVSTYQPGLHFVGGAKFLPGMLDRQVVRRNLNQSQQQSDLRLFSVVGEMVTSNYCESWGVPVATLSELHWRICKDIRNRTKTALTPSIVQFVRYARLLAITFCRAQAECTRCFQPLCGIKKDTGSKERPNDRNPTSGVVSSVSVSDFVNRDRSTSFWHLPLSVMGEPSAVPTVSCNGTVKLVKGRMQATSSTRKVPTNLRCPNDCPLHYASVKWECSGVVDDGTGQAKLHAERDAALTLLGKGLKVCAIEEGAWRNEGGVLFHKSVPPKSYVKHAVREAQYLANQLVRQVNSAKKNKIHVSEDDILKMLTPQARAEYLLQLHCRQSLEPSRPLHLLCRCKPLSDDAYHLNRTQVECTAATSTERMEPVMHDAVSYSLPPLKLNLVDCCAVETSTVLSNWDMVRKFRI